MSDICIKIIAPSTGNALKVTERGLVGLNATFPEIKGAYRIVETENYASSFGFQWNKYAKTQLDQFKHSQNQSEVRFFKETGWVSEKLEGAILLEVGSGAGRFSNVILRKTKAILYSVDYSSAVEVNFHNNGPNDRLFLFQASIYELPFAPQQFDKVVCLGVLQHTPDFRASVQALVGMVKPGGELVIDFYPIRGWWTKLHAKYIFRPLTRQMNHNKLLALIETNIGWLMKAYQFFDKIGLGKVVNRFLPICDIKHTLPTGLSPNELKEWVILDTFDMFSPRYDQPQKIQTVARWVAEAGLKVSFAGEVVFDNAKASVIRALRKIETQ